MSMLPPSRSNTAQAETCGWQISGEKFLWNGKPETAIIPKVRLGMGTMGDVWEVVAQGSEEPMVRKSVYARRQNVQRAREVIKTEIQNLKLLNHTHIVKVIGYYEERAKGSSFELHMLMHPVGEEDLHEFLHETCLNASKVEREQFQAWISTWFTCLASALAYMHAQHILHEDIKPANIIHRGGRVYFTDFSSSRKMKVDLETSTTSEAIATRLYAAPEAFFQDGKGSRHGSKTDVFALGIVFVEMLSVGVGATVEELREYLFGDTTNMQPYHKVTNQILLWFAQKRAKTLAEETLILQEMLASARNERPNALGVFRTLGQNQLLTPGRVCECLHRRRSSIPPPADNGLSNQPARSTTHAFLEGVLHQPRPSHDQTELADLLGWQTGANKYVWSGELAPASRLVRASEWIRPNGIAVRREVVYCYSEAGSDVESANMFIRCFGSLNHRHVVPLIGGYADYAEKFARIELYFIPLAKATLKDFFYRQHHYPEERQVEQLKTWFVCLASAVACLHARSFNLFNLRPEDIVISDHNIQIARITSYRAQYLDANSFPPENSIDAKVGVLCLGFIFLEMLSAMYYNPVPWTEFEGNELRGEELLQAWSFPNPFLPEVSKWYYSLPRSNSEIDMFKACLEPMFQSRHENRPTARKILSTLVEHRAKMSMSVCDCVEGLL